MIMWRMVLAIIGLLCLSGCHHDDHKRQADRWVSVTAQPITTTLFFSGIVQPLKTVVITSPAEGVIDDMSFHYGDVVKAAQPLLTVASDKFQTDYKAALLQYIKSKTEFTNSDSQLKQAAFLHQNQLISDDDYKSKKTNYYSAQLSLVQAKDVLGAMLKQLDVQGFNLYDLSIEDVDKISQAFHVKSGSQKLHITAPNAGVVLLPIKNDNDSTTKKLVKGDQVKQGDVLAMIGDVSGLTIHINVNEYNINQLKVGQKVKVTGGAFSDMTLQGEISGIDRQAQASQGGAPVFPVDIVVPKLTPSEQAVIHMGMSAKVEINIQSEPVVTVPIRAVFEKNGSTFVKVQDPENKKIREVLVRTGQTSFDSVVIESNLKPGDHIVFID